MTTVAESVAAAATEYAEPVYGAVRKNLRDVRRAIASGRHAVEDCTDTTALHVRRHPFASIGIAAGVGLLVGCVLGFAIDRPARGRTAP
jgi:ElaB/YqjD/DUF883 family membrane-anchored ribosome-binding protein